MSKTAQRKRDAYNKGYRVGRYGQWDSSAGYSFRQVAANEFERGRAAGRRDRLASTARRPSLISRIAAWLKGAFQSRSERHP